MLLSGFVITDKRRTQNTYTHTFARISQEKPTTKKSFVQIVSTWEKLTKDIKNSNKTLKLIIEYCPTFRGLRKLMLSAKWIFRCKNLVQSRNFSFQLSKSRKEMETQCLRYGKSAINSQFIEWRDAEVCNEKSQQNGKCSIFFGKIV